VRLPSFLRDLPPERRAFKLRTKVNSLWQNPGPLIALHSPSALLETGLRMCPPEKSQDSDHLRYRAVRSLQSGLFANNREKWAYSAYFGGKGSGLSLQFRLRGESGIHNIAGTYFSCNRLAVLDSIVTTFLTTTSTSIPPQTEVGTSPALPDVPHRTSHL
jgi:hypothetical protein